eukprot:Plantae.Rhodophyta-Purpureofilum_apyrenoidigerum.ctg6558.p1 GENE.Plantae.Rhodophyta-Purpureofilum_apyrenoidigerum.ctg6558~~Plantae.Rhodophyta-Purpureofilum_apyrenoidigerum.ctg6558.p1  ORF type:complete len:278 (+),score=46.46 Plantae.Rhodophyta-Purpureofilum_apyrenoidigerum.ctg6558:84-836(+)
MAFVSLQSSVFVQSSSRRGVSGRCRRVGRCMIRAEVDVTSFPPEPSKDAVDVNKPPMEYSHLRNMLCGTSVFLVGMMGSGKSSVADYLAKAIRYNKLDTDDIVQTLMKMPITDIFETHGEKGFREVESAVLQQVSAYVRTVISTGGGVVCNQQNWSHLQSGLVVWLDTPVESILKRLKGDKSRPLLNVNDPHSRLQSILDERRAFYQQADVQVAVEEGEGVEEVSFNVVRGLTRFIETNPPRSAAHKPLQ